MLYIVGTAIGNIEDTSLRAVKTLAQADVILAEDTRSYGSYYKRIVALFGVKVKPDQKIISFHDQNEYKNLSYVLKILEKNLEVAIVSEAGMPLVSDPGVQLVREAMKRGHETTVIPGPTAFVNAAVLSGFSTERLIFIGFAPKKGAELLKVLQEFTQLKSKKMNPTFVFYESPHRIAQTLQILYENYPNAQVAICREMTKKFEEVIRGMPSELMKKNYKGELTVVVSQIV